MIQDDRALDKARQNQNVVVSELPRSHPLWLLCPVLCRATPQGGNPGVQQSVQDPLNGEPREGGEHDVAR